MADGQSEEKRGVKRKKTPEEMREERRVKRNNNNPYYGLTKSQRQDLEWKQANRLSRGFQVATTRIPNHLLAWSELLDQRYPQIIASRRSHKRCGHDHRPEEIAPRNQTHQQKDNVDI